METYLLMAATVIFACVIFNKISSKLGIPALLAFILLGMFFGSDGIVKIPFDNYEFTQQICTVALLFIMFYGGFGTKWSEAKPVVAKSVLLSSLGTIVTAGLVGLFCYFALKVPVLEGLLIGSVISSTDAASVFAILRAKRLNLRYNTASLLEIESGSNDPFAYMLTVVILSVMNGRSASGNIAYMIFAQVVFGVFFGVLIALLTLMFLKKYKFVSVGYDAIFIVAVAVISYAVPSFFGGNGYLSTYITGIILGNRNIENKQQLAHFFDVMTGFMQMLLFFLLGLLSFPSNLPDVAFMGLMVALFLTFVARPVSVFAILTPFKSKLNQQLIVSWAGMRGAASIVFAITAVINPALVSTDIFHIVFFIVLFSILLQGRLLPWVSKKLDMIDNKTDVMKTFNDYVDEVPVQFIQLSIKAEHPWKGKMISEIVLPPDSILVLLIRDGVKIVPNGQTFLVEDDILVLSGKAMDEIDGVNLYEKEIKEDDGLSGKKLYQLPVGEKLIIMIKRGDKVIIPRGSTQLEIGDLLVVNDAKMHRSLTE